MRGKELGTPIEDSAERITPAYAGKSLSVSPTRTVLRDHPRLCGEKSTNREGGAPAKGSPPPMRGKDLHRPRERILQGITPAYAGKSQPPSGQRPKWRDHPRLCGEKNCFFLMLHGVLGSPPPMRGKGNFSAAVRSGSRITPAYAGKSAVPSLHGA